MHVFISNGQVSTSRRIVLSHFTSKKSISSQNFRIKLSIVYTKLALDHHGYGEDDIVG